MFDHILVPLDGSKLAECVLPHVVAITRPFRSRVTLLQVLEAGSEHTTGASFVDPFHRQLGIAETEAYLDGVARRLGDAGIGTQRVILEGCPARQIVEFARSCNVDLVVLSSHGRSGLSRWNLSGVAYKIVSLAHLSVMIVRAYQSVDSGLTDLSYHRLLVPVDGSRRAECVLPPATILASFYDSDVVLAHVVSRPQMICLTPLPREAVQLLDRWVNRSRLAATGYLEQLSSRLSVDVWTRLIVDDDVAGALFGLAAGESADMVVLSAHGHSGVAVWPYGHTAANFIDHGTTSLLIVQDIAPDHIGRSLPEIAVDEQKGRPSMYAATGKQ